MVFPFGKHKNEEVEDVETSYLQWWIENIDPPAVGKEGREAALNLNTEIEEELAYRRKYD